MAGLEDKVVIVTGSSGGIGASAAVEFAKVGAKVVLTARRRNKLEETAQKCIDVGLDKDKVLVVEGDIMKDEDLSKIMKATIERFSRLDVLVNNAGVSCTTSFVTSSVEDMDEMYKMHVRAPYLLMKLALPHLLKTKGNVVNVSSLASLRPWPSPYSVAKCAQDQMTKGASIELGPKGVRVNSVCPGSTLTEIFEKINFGGDTPLDEVMNEMALISPLKRNALPTEMGRVIVFLASDDASFVSGVNMAVDGGSHNTSWMPASKMTFMQ